MMQICWCPYERSSYEAILDALQACAPGGLCPDFSRVLVIVPGRQWLRNLQEALIARFPDGVCPPRILTPGSALWWGAGEAHRTTDGEQLCVLQHLLPEKKGSPELKVLLPERPSGWSESDYSEAAEQLLALRQELVRNGKSIPEAAAVLARQDARWDALETLDGWFREKLAELGLPDPADEQQKAIQAPGMAEDFDAVLIAFVPDLPLLLQRKLEPLAARLTILIHGDAVDRAAFDAWGRPELAWTSRQLPLAANTLHAAGDLRQASLLALQLAASGGVYLPDETAIVLGRPSFFPALAREFAKLRDEKDGKAAELFSPEGVPGTELRIGRFLQALQHYLSRPEDFEALSEFLREPDLLRTLPQQCSGETAPTENRILELLDRFTVEYLPEQSSAALRRMTDKFAELAAAVQAARKLAAGAANGADGGRGVQTLLETVFPAPEYPPVFGVPFAEERTFWRDALGALRESPVLPLLPDAAAQLRYLLEEAGRTRFFPKRMEREVAAYNLLELSALTQRRIILIGVNNGIVPPIPGITPFLNDSVRKAIGLPGADALRALETFRLFSLLRSGREVHLLTLTADETAAPLYPAVMLFQDCKDAELLARAKRCRTVVQLRETAENAGGGGAFQLDFRRIAETPFFQNRPLHLAVTAFKEYLSSPRAFLLQKAFGVDFPDYRTRELDDGAFGTACHIGLEALVRQDCNSEEEFERVLRTGADQWLTRQYGTPLPLLIRLQQHQIHARLQAAAKFLAREKRNGDFILLEAEYQLNDGERIAFGGALLKGQIDRIEYSPSQKVLRLIDVKTYNAAISPENSHRQGRGKNRKLVNLQLPLYDRLLRLDAKFWRKHGLEPDNVTVQAGYLVLTNDGEEPALLLWKDDFAGACRQAEAVVQQVVAELEAVRDQGILPPEPDNASEYYQFSPLLLPNAAAAITMGGNR